MQEEEEFRMNECMGLGLGLEEMPLLEAVSRGCGGAIQYPAPDPGGEVRPPTDETMLVESGATAAGSTQKRVNWISIFHGTPLSQ